MGRPAARRQAQTAQSDSGGTGRAGSRASRKHLQSGIVGGRKRATRSSTKAVVTPESLQQEEAGVATECHRLGLVVKDVKGDGNCLYRSCSDQLYGNDAHHAELRRQVCDYLAAHPDFAIFLDPDLNLRWEQYVSLQRRSTEYGGYLELLAIARLYRRSVRVVMASNSYTVAWFDESDPSNASSSTQPYTPPSPPASIRTRSRSTTATTDSHQTLVEPSLAPQPGASMIWVALYESAEHYSSIRVQGRMEDAARVPDKLCVHHNAATHTSEPVETGQPTSREALLQRVLSALPPGSVSLERVKSVLERARGDWEQAVEVLLEEDVVSSTPETSPCPSGSSLPDESSVVSDLVPAAMDLDPSAEDYLRGSPPAADAYRSLTPTSASTSPSCDSSAADSSGSSAIESRSGTGTPPPRKRPGKPRDESMLERIRKPQPISPTDGTSALAHDTANMLDKIVIRTSPPSPSASASSHEGKATHSKRQIKGARKPRTRSGVSPSREADGSKLSSKTHDTSMGSHRLTRNRDIAT